MFFSYCTGINVQNLILASDDSHRKRTLCMLRMNTFLRRNQAHHQTLAARTCSRDSRGRNQFYEPGSVHDHHRVDDTEEQWDRCVVGSSPRARCVFKILLLRKPLDCSKEGSPLPNYLCSLTAFLKVVWAVVAQRTSMMVLEHRMAEGVYCV